MIEIVANEPVEFQPPVPPFHGILSNQCTMDSNIDAFAPNECSSPPTQQGCPGLFMVFR